LCRSNHGIVAQHAGRPRDPSSTGYLFITVWEDFDPGPRRRTLAGEAVIAPDEEHLLKDTWIQHYDTLLEPESESSATREDTGSDTRGIGDRAPRRWRSTTP
jgi:hypothetical protein